MSLPKNNENFLLRLEARSGKCVHAASIDHEERFIKRQVFNLLQRPEPFPACPAVLVNVSSDIPVPVSEISTNVYIPSVISTV